MKLRLSKIIGFIGICIFVAGVSYIFTKYLDKNLYLNTNILVTFEDTKEFSLESTEKLTKEEALKVYPNTFKVENKSLKLIKYSVIYEEKESNLEEDDLSYILYLNNKEIKDGKISDLKDNLLYNGSIKMKKTDVFKLYLYLNNEKDEVKYNYTIKIDSK